MAFRRSLEDFLVESMALVVRDEETVVHWRKRKRTTPGRPTGAFQSPITGARIDLTQNRPRSKVSGRFT